MADDKERAARQWEEMDPETRAFLARLKSEDIDLLENGIELVRSSLTVGRFVKWLVITCLGFFFGGIMLWEGILKVIKWFKGAG